MKKGYRLMVFGSLALMMIFGVGKAVFAAGTKEERAEEILKHMSWKEKVAQMFVVAAPKSNAAKVQKKYQFGGYVFFANDFKGRTPKQVKAMISKIQKKSKIKMIMAVDEEGGTVTRVSSFSVFRKKRFDSPRNVFARGGYSAIVKDTKEKDKLLKRIGLNTNFAPVADVAYKSSNFIYKRSFSTNAKSVSKFIQKTVKQMKKDKVISTLKHFPGYGGNGDTHTNVIRDKRTLNTFKKRDLLPFGAGIKSGCDMIMVSHNIVECFDKKNPASVSKKVHRYLRKDMGFEGVIITDSLSMAGVAGYTGSSGQVAVKAVQAGNDILLSTNYSGQYKAVYAALKKGKIKKKQINESVKRILLMKLNRGIIK